MGRWSGRVILAAVVAVSVVWLLAKNRDVRHAAAATVGASVTIRDEVENLPASSWKAIPYQRNENSLHTVTELLSLKE